MDSLWSWNVKRKVSFSYFTSETTVESNKRKMQYRKANFSISSTREIAIRQYANEKSQIGYYLFNRTLSRANLNAFNRMESTVANQRVYKADIRSQQGRGKGDELLRLVSSDKAARSSNAVAARRLKMLFRQFLVFKESNN